MSERPSDSEILKRLYGRRRGHRLRPGRQRLLDDLLPRLRVVPAEFGAPVDPAALFPGAQADIWLEVGFGAGEHLAEQAAAHPDVGIIGCEPFIDGVANLLTLIEARSLHNVRIFDDNARILFASLPDACLGRVYVLFNDPWPKARHAKRRFLNPETLDTLARLMKDGAELRFATDDTNLMIWSLERLAAHPDFAWTARRPADWRNRPADGFETRYEAKATAAGRACTYLNFRRIARGLTGG